MTRDSQRGTTSHKHCIASQSTRSFSKQNEIGSIRHMRHLGRFTRWRRSGVWSLCQFDRFPEGTMHTIPSMDVVDHEVDEKPKAAPGAPSSPQLRFSLPTYLVLFSHQASSSRARRTWPTAVNRAHSPRRCRPTTPDDNCRSYVVSSSSSSSSSSVLVTQRMITREKSKFES